MATNNLTAQKVVLDLLQYIGVTGFDAPSVDQALNQPGLDVVDTTRAIAAVNEALQDWSVMGPNNVREGTSSCLYVAPTAITLDIVHGAKVATASVAPPTTGKGCSILIDGDGEMNRIMGYPTLPVNGVTLLRAYLGPTNPALAATIYYDCATLDAEVQTVEAPVYGTPGKIELRRADDLQHFERLRRRCWLEDWPGGYIGTVESVANRLGTPALYLTERQPDGTVFLRVTPIPPSDFVVTFPMRKRAERITVSVLDTGGGPDPNYYFNSLHDDEVESYLLPIARWKFFSHPALKNNESRGTVKAQYDAVLQRLTNGSKLETATETPTARYI